ncbi:MAG: LysE family transporter [Burkholderiales bacterium]
MLATLAAIWILHVATMAVPGVNALLIFKLAAGEGGRGGPYAALGIAIGALMWATAAALGVNALFAAFPGFRTALQLAGAGYLLYLGVRLWFAGPPRVAAQSSWVSSVAAFRLGLLTNVTNPKAALFFGSVFSAALPAQPSMALMLSAVALVVFNAFWWHMLLAYLFSRQRVRAAYALRWCLLNRVSGSIAGAFGLSLVMAAVRDSAAGAPSLMRIAD